ncbi:MAG: phosphate acetyltransferase [Anaerolineae bacterium]|nr:phosphate acetyltransferase [Anaerolineae bacterium]
MSKSIFLATTDAYSGKSLVSVGITELILRRTNKVGVFRPVISRGPEEGCDKNIDLLLTHFRLPLDYEETYAFSQREASDLIAHGGYDAFLDRIIEKYKALESKVDFILCIGSDLEGDGAVFEFDINADVARHLGCPVLIVTSGVGRDPDTIANTVRSTHDTLVERGSQLLGAIVNRADPPAVNDIRLALQEALPENDMLLSVIPANEVLSRPTVAEIGEHLDAEVLYGKAHLDKLAHQYLVIAMQVHNYLPHLTENSLLITPGDRSDVILSALQAHQSQHYPQIAAIVLTGGLKPADSVARLLDGLSDVVPILSVETHTFDTAARMASVRSYITSENRAKIALSLELFEEFVDTRALLSKVQAVQPRGVTPKMFLYNLVQLARSDRKHIVLPEGNDERILRAAEVLLNRDIVDLSILGDTSEVWTSIQRLGLQIDPTKVQVINPASSPWFGDFAETLVGLRKHKGVNMDMATDWMNDVSYFGTMMVYKGLADGMVSGAAHTTQHTIRPALQFVKTKPGVSVVSSVFFMALPDKVLVYGDCAVVPNPTAQELAEIAISSADTARAFGIDPLVAMLSYSTGESGQGADVERVREATQLARQRRPDLKLEGPMQYDAAVDPETAAKKLPGSEVAGRATVFVFPDLNTGNNTYKAVQRETGAIAIGPVLQGLNKPVNDLSRGCTVEDIINTVVITAIQAQHP